MALKQIKNNIKATERTSKVTRAMEAVSAVKMRKAQERALSGRPYAEAALRILDRVSRAQESKNHLFFKDHEQGKICIIVSTSDKGLAGAFNSGVFREVQKVLQQHADDTVSMICFGKKSFEFFQKRGFSIPKHYLNVRDDVAIEDVEETVRYIVDAYLTKEYRKVYVVYQNFLSTFEQKPVVRQILPIHRPTLIDIVSDIVPRQGKYSDQKHTEKKVEYHVEPTREIVYTHIIPVIINVMMYHTLLESKASEHSARMVAMKNATDKAKEVVRSLTIKYNKERQGIITAEVSEITGGIEAMKT